MTKPTAPRLDNKYKKLLEINNTLDFEAFAQANIIDKRADQIRKAFHLIWIAHRIYPVLHPQDCPGGALRKGHYLLLRDEIEEQTSKDAGEDYTINIPDASIDKALARMNAAGYLRHNTQEHTWHVSAKAANVLADFADTIRKFQKPVTNQLQAQKLIHDFRFNLTAKPKEKKRLRS